MERPPYLSLHLGNRIFCRAPFHRGRNFKLGRPLPMEVAAAFGPLRPTPAHARFPLCGWMVCRLRGGIIKCGLPSPDVSVGPRCAAGMGPRLDEGMGED
jgi:hypothetical protein